MDQVMIFDEIEKPKSNVLEFMDKILKDIKFKVPKTNTQILLTSNIKHEFIFEKSIDHYTNHHIMDKSGSMSPPMPPTIPSVVVGWRSGVQVYRTSDGVWSSDIEFAKIFQNDTDANITSKMLRPLFGIDPDAVPEVNGISSTPLTEDMIGGKPEFLKKVLGISDLDKDQIIVRLREFPGNHMIWKVLRDIFPMHFAWFKKAVEIPKAA